MAIIDTSLLYALLDADDRWHDEAKKKTQQHRPIVVPAGIIQETIDLLAYRHSVHAARKALQWLADEPSFDLVAQAPTDELSGSIALFLDSDQDVGRKRLSLADCCAIQAARTRGGALLTKDSHQETVFNKIC